METDNKPSSKERRKKGKNNLHLYIHFSMSVNVIWICNPLFLLSGSIVLRFYKAKGKRSKLITKVYRLVPVSKLHVRMRTVTSLLRTTPEN